MGKSKIVYDGEVLIDLTGDTVKADKLLAGYTTHGADGEPIEGSCTFDADTSDATAEASEVLENETVYVRGVKLTGTMPNKGAVNGTISAKDGVYKIPYGLHDGSGEVSIDPSEQVKLIPSNIRQGITILNVEGSMSGMEGEVAQEKTVTPSTEAQTIVPDEGYTCLSNVVVNAIPYVESANAAGGITVTIG